MQPCNLEGILVAYNMIASFKSTRAVSLWVEGVSRILARVRGAHLMSVVTNFVSIWKNIAEVHFICFFFFFFFLSDNVGERGLEADGRPCISISLQGSTSLTKPHTFLIELYHALTFSFISADIVIQQSSVNTGQSIYSSGSSYNLLTFHKVPH